MQQTGQFMIRHIRSVYDSFTEVEKMIADYFINNREQEVFSSKNIAAKLYVSEASLSRFAKKCGYKGFREFIYDYEKMVVQRAAAENIDSAAAEIFDMYREFLERSYMLVSAMKMEKITGLFEGCHRIVIYGRGSMACVAKEMALRFMHTDMYVEAVTDMSVMQRNTLFLKPEVMVIVLVTDGLVAEMLSVIKNAKNCGAKVIVMTPEQDSRIEKYSDAVIGVANMQGGDGETAMLSPQLPVFMMVDILYASFIKYDVGNRAGSSRLSVKKSR